MKRTWVYVNTNPDKKHITIHLEINRPCSTISQNIKKGGIYQQNTKIEIREGGKEIIIGRTENGFWICLWEKDINNIINLAKTKYAKKSFNKICDIPEEKIKICDMCK